MHLPNEPGAAGRYMLSVFNEQKLRRMLARMLDESEFLSPYGTRPPLCLLWRFVYSGMPYRLGKVYDLV